MKMQSSLVTHGVGEQPSPVTRRAELFGHKFELKMDEMFLIQRHLFLCRGMPKTKKLVTSTEK